MSGTAKKYRITTTHDSDQRETLVQLNNALAALDTLLAKLDADAGVTDTDYASLIGSTYSPIKSGSGATVTNP